MDDIQEQISLYEAIIEVNYEYWITENELDVEVEDFRLQVDLRYRLRFQTFPVGDEHIEARMDEICDEVGEELVTNEITSQENEESNKLKERFLKSVEIFPVSYTHLTLPTTPYV